MKNILAVFILIILVSSCREDLITESTIIDDPIPTNTFIYEFSVFGLVEAEDGTPIVGADVIAVSMLEMSDENGYFEFDGLVGTEEGVYIAAKKDGYIDGGVLITPNEENAQQVKIVLLKDNGSTLIASADGGVVALQSGAEVVIPANAFDETGNVNVKAHFIPNTKENFYEVYPSGFVGTDANDETKYLNSIGAVVVDFTDDDGNELQIKEDIEVLLKMPVPNDGNDWPEEIDLWSLNETSGYWEEESSAQKVGDFYEGNVSHFSWWSAGEPTELVDVCFTVKDESDEPVANVEILFLSWQSATIQSGFTDSQGGFCSKLGVGEDVILIIVDECYATIYEESFAVTTEQSEKDIIISAIPVKATFEGEIRTCDGSVVEDGYLSFDFGYDKRIVQIDNGSYSFVSYCGLSGEPVEVLAVDRSDFSSSMLSIDIEVGKTNYLRDVTLCETLEFYLEYENVTKGTELIFTDCEALRNPTETLVIAKDLDGSSDNVLLGVEGFGVGEFGTSFLGLRSETALPEAFKTTFTTYQNIGGYVEGTFKGTTDDGDSIKGQFKAIRTK